MAGRNTLDSNITGLRIAEEETDCVGVLPTTPVWKPYEPNSYADFGGEITTVARAPINPDRQRQKGVVTDLDASGGFNTDLTQVNLQDILQGFFFADLRNNEEFGGAGEITNVDGTTEDYDAASGLDAYQVGDLVFASGFGETANNGLKRVTAAAATALTVAEDLVDETPPAAAKLVRVGFRGVAGDIDVDASGDLPKLTSTSLDFTTLDLVPGQPIWVGGDSAALGFATAANNGFKRVRSIAANELVLDKSDADMVTEASTTETVELYFGRVLKNETGALIKRRSYQLERTLGDDGSGTQSEYLVGGLPNEATFNVQTADKVNVDLSFIATSHETRDGATGVKTGTRPALVAGDAFNTSSDVTRFNMHVVDPTDEAPTALFSFVQEITITINNGIEPAKAVGTLGAIDASAGDFQVGGQVTAYFSDVAAVEAVRANSNVSLDAHFVKDNAGVSFDIPLITLGDGRVNVEKDAAITLPLSLEAASGEVVDTGLNHTLLMSFWDYLPTAAE